MFATATAKTDCTTKQLVAEYKENTNDLLVLLILNRTVEVSELIREFREVKLPCKIRISAIHLHPSLTQCFDGMDICVHYASNRAV